MIHVYICLLYYVLAHLRPYNIHIAIICGGIFTSYTSPSVTSRQKRIETGPFFIPKLYLFITYKLLLSERFLHSRHPTWYFPRSYLIRHVSYTTDEYIIYVCYKLYIDTYYYSVTIIIKKKKRFLIGLTHTHVIFHLMYYTHTPR